MNIVKVLFIFLLLINLSFASLIEDFDVNLEKHAIQVGSYREKESVNKALKNLSNESTFYYTLSNYYVVYIVNLKNSSVAKNKLEKLKITYPDSILLTNLNILKKYIYPKQNNFTEKFNSAKEQFLAKDYEKAYESFYKLFLSNLQDPNVNFYLGQSAFMLKRYEDAISAYDRVLFVNEKSNRTKLELARCYMGIKDNKKAQTLFLEVLNSDVPDNVKDNVKVHLKIIDDQKVKHTLNGAVIFGVNYDTNIYGVTVDNALSDKIQNLVLANNISMGWAHQDVIAANYTYAKSDSVKYKVDTILFNKTLFNYHDMDINLVQATPALSVMYDKQLTIDYALFVNKIWLRRVPLMINWGLNPKIKYKYSPTWIFDTAFKLQIQKNAPNTFQRDNTLYSLEGGAKHIYNEKWTLGAKVKVDLVREKHLNETNNLGANIESNEVAYNLYDLTLSANYKYSKKVMISPKLRIFHKNYIDPSISPITQLELYKRKDREYQMWLSGTYIYTPTRLFTFEYIHSKHNSNYVDNEFNKDSFSANVIIPF